MPDGTCATMDARGTCSGTISGDDASSNYGGTCSGTWSGVECRGSLTNKVSGEYPCLPWCATRDNCQELPAEPNHAIMLLRVSTCENTHPSRAPDRLIPSLARHIWNAGAISTPSTRRAATARRTRWRIGAATMCTTPTAETCASGQRMHPFGRIAFRACAAGSGKPPEP